MVFQFIFALFLECDDDQGDEYINEEERKDNEIDDVKDRHFHTRTRFWTFIFFCGVHGMLQDAGSEIAQQIELRPKIKMKSK